VLRVEGTGEWAMPPFFLLKVCGKILDPTSARFNKVAGFCVGCAPEREYALKMLRAKKR
jgi:hypothetical protein